MKQKLQAAVFSIALALTASSCGVMFGGSKFSGSIIVKITRMQKSM